MNEGKIKSRVFFPAAALAQQMPPQVRHVTPLT